MVGEPRRPQQILAEHAARAENEHLHRRMDSTGTVSRVLRAWLSRPLVGVALALPAPILAGDWPDPSAIRVGNETVAVATSEESAPIFRVLRSSDLRNWRIAGSVFTRPPRWAKQDFWAPEITRLSDGRFAVFYSALPRSGKTWLCLGVATAPAPEGPWRDMGRPLRCGKYGSIDPYLTRDERGHLYLLWKEDGNEFKKPTPIFAQKLREDGRRLLGRAEAADPQRQEMGAQGRGGRARRAPRRVLLPPLLRRPVLHQELRLRGGGGALQAAARPVAQVPRQPDPAQRQRLALPRPRDGRG